MEPFVFIVALIGILGAITGWKILVSRKREDDELINREQLALDVKINEEIADAEKQLELFSKHITKINVLSHNLWTGEEYENLITSIRYACSKNRSKLGIFDFDYDAIISSSKNSAHDAPGKAQSQIALNRLGILGKLNALQIVTTNPQSKSRRFRDPDILDILAQPTNERDDFMFFTEDKSLMARLQKRISDNSRAYWHIVNVEDHLEACTIIAKGLNEFTALRRLERNFSKQSPPSS